MKNKKPNKIQFADLEPLSQNPFAALGQKFGIAPPPPAEPVQPSAPAPKVKAKVALPEGPKLKASTPKDASGRPSLLVRLENRKNGKQVTCIYHLGDEAADLLKKLKSKLGTGGTLGEKALELQGDHRKTVASLLEAEGYKLRIG